MAQAGWYPDPEGSDRPRYWDGSRWAEQSTPPQHHRRGMLALAAGLVVVAAIVVAIIMQPWKTWSATPEDTRSARPTGSQWNEGLPTPTPTEEPQPTDGGRPVECPIDRDATTIEPEGGWYHSGRMKFQGVRGWDDGSHWTIDFATERGGQVVTVGENWVAVTAIGQLQTKTGFANDPQIAAQQVIDCMSTSYYYRTLDHKKPVENRAFTTSDGVSGWIIREEFWNAPDYHIVGDEVVVVVLDTGDADRLTLFHTEAPIDNEKRKQEVAGALETLSRR